MRIILADHHPKTLGALKTMLCEKSEFEVAGEAANAADLLSLAFDRQPDLALLDWELPDLPIKELIKKLHSCRPRPFVVVIGSNPEYMKTLLKAGADAFVSKIDEPGWLLDTLLRFANLHTTKKEK